MRQTLFKKAFQANFEADLQHHSTATKPDKIDKGDRIAMLTAGETKI